jgi:8-oxo-dGTP pyrophosphatase MutT (NUDIX family)
VRLDQVSRALDRSLVPADAPAPAPVHAAVAGVLREGGRGAELLLIERVKRPGDPWSGQMALPGGRVQAEDASPLHTAIRETHEETGVELSGAPVLGRLDEQAPSSSGGGLRVAGYVFTVGDASPVLRPDYQEIADALWLPLATLLEPARYRDYQYPLRPGMTFPAVAIDGSRSAVCGEASSVNEGRVVWGLTLRFLADLFERLGHPFPAR